MAVWEVRTVNQNGDRFWENVWHIDVGSATDVPSDMLIAFQDFALITLLNIYEVARIVRRPLGSTDEFIEIIVEEAGSRGLNSSFALPLFNVVRVLLAGGAGRPGLKLIRGFLLAVDIVDELNSIDPDLVDTFQGYLNTLFNAASTAGCTFVFGAADKPAVSAIPEPKVQMRQLHRKRRNSA